MSDPDYRSMANELRYKEAQDTRLMHDLDHVEAYIGEDRDSIRILVDDVSGYAMTQRDLKTHKLYAVFYYNSYFHKFESISRLGSWNENYGTIKDVILTPQLISLKKIYLEPYGHFTKSVANQLITKHKKMHAICLNNYQSADDFRTSILKKITQ